MNKQQKTMKLIEALSERIGLIKEHARIVESYADDTDGRLIDWEHDMERANRSLEYYELQDVIGWTEDYFTMINAAPDFIDEALEMIAEQSQEVRSLTLLSDGSISRAQHPGSESIYTIYTDWSRWADSVATEAGAFDWSVFPEFAAAVEKHIQTLAYDFIVAQVIHSLR